MKNTILYFSDPSFLYVIKWDTPNYKQNFFITFVLFALIIYWRWSLIIVITYKEIKILRIISISNHYLLNIKTMFIVEKAYLQHVIVVQVLRFKRNLVQHPITFYTNLDHFSISLNFIDDGCWILWIKTWGEFCAGFKWTAKHLFSHIENVWLWNLQETRLWRSKMIKWSGKL